MCKETSVETENKWLMKFLLLFFDKKKRVIHINIASSATATTNELLFKLLVLGHINTPDGDSYFRYNTKTADSYFVELPVNILMPFACMSAYLITSQEQAYMNSAWSPTFIKKKNSVRRSQKF